jgi:hypothetical protein
MAKLETFTDLFNQGTLNTGLWTQFTAGSATFTYGATGAQVNYPASSTSSTDGDISSNTTYDLTASYGFVHVITVPSAATAADAAFRVSQNATNWYRFVYEGGTLFCQKQIAGVTATITSFAYNATTHAYWRISESGGTISWDTSTDGLSWTSRATFLNTLTITAVSVLLAGTCFKNETSPGIYKWNNFNILPSVTSTASTLLMMGV